MGTDCRRNDIQRWETVAGCTIQEMGTDGRRHDIQRRELMASDRTHKTEYCWQAFRYTEMGIDVRLYDIKGWVLLASDTIFRDGK